MSNGQVTTLPLQGKRVLVTRTPEQAGALRMGLQALGAIPLEFPTIRIVPPTDWTPLDVAFKRLYPSSQQAHDFVYDWLVFTSANGVNICLQRLQTLGSNLHTLRNVRIAAIGPATAATLAQYGLVADVVPDTYVAESVAEAIIADTQRRGLSVSGQHILLARAAEARKVLATMLREAGASVDDVPVYDTRTVARDDERGRELWRMLAQQQLDMLTFASSSTVKNFMTWLRECEAAMGVTLTHLPAIASIGPITSQTARELGLTVAVEAKAFTIDGLLEALVLYNKGKIA